MRFQLFAAVALAALASLVASGVQAAVLLNGVAAPGDPKVQSVSGVATAVTEDAGATIGAAGGQNLGAAVRDMPIILVPQGLPAILVPPQITAIPEPAAWALMLVGFGGLGGMLRHRRQRDPIAR